MASKTRIANLALSRIGVSRVIANVDTDRSQEAVLVRQLFDGERDATLADFWWKFATGFVDLGLVSDPDVAFNSDWKRAYQYPANTITVRRILRPGAGRQDPTPPPFTIARGAAGKIVLTDYDEPTVETTMLITNTEEFPPHFYSMLAWRLGISLAPSLSRVDGIVRTCAQAYELERLQAGSRTGNEGKDDPPAEADWITARE